jgi:hypothetical protein
VSPKFNSLVFEEKEQLQEHRYEPELTLFDKPEFFSEARIAEEAIVQIAGKMTVSF